MRQSQRILPVYAGDVSGACSALFELGGMVVIHDPSGCNSTYNTHDELRWYDQDSLVFVSGLRHADALMGNDERLVADVVEAVGQTRPRFVVLAGSPVPFQVGTDFAALARLVEARTGVVCRHVPTNGMHDYVRGAGLAFALLARAFVTAAREGTRAARPPRARVNVLGMTPLDFAAPTSRESLVGWLEGEGFALTSLWSLGCTLDDVMRASQADVNLVVSACGLDAARELERRLGQPYVVGLPVRGFGPALARALDRARDERRSRNAYLELRLVQSRDKDLLKGGIEAPRTPASAALALVGEPVAMGSMAAALGGRDVTARLVSPVEDARRLVDPRLGDVCVRGEEGVARALREAAIVVGDPFFSHVCARDQRLCRLPHLALSGRQWLREIPDLMSVDPMALVGDAMRKGA
ncbi:nitrogenase component 1 [Olsenella massiliensis]|uniref:nitrogenase component 1 n=1 Tax=Olsenella massiliensis TaxID=1622075 RepID=UPI00071DB731|nr:nitrogenase component 1 [Olsenella massiliensis]